MFEKTSRKNADLTTDYPDLAEMSDFFKSFEAFLSDPGASSQDDPMEDGAPSPRSPPDSQPEKPKKSKSPVQSVPKQNVIYKAHLNPSGSSRELKVTLKTVPKEPTKKYSVPSKPIVPPILPRKQTTPPPIVHKPIKPINGKVHPPTYPPPNRPGRNTNQLAYIKKSALPLIWDHKFGWPFHKPVDAIKLHIPDYFKIIQQPMDLGTIKKRLSNKYYWTSKECSKDFETMFKNCLLYNKEGQDITMMAKTLENVFQTKIKSMPPIEVDLNAPTPPKVVKKSLPTTIPSEVKRSIFESQEYKAHKKVKTKVRVKEMKNIDFETEIPLAQIGWPSGITVGPDEKKLVTSTKQNQVESDDDSDEYDSEESDDSSESESDNDKVGTAPGVLNKVGPVTGVSVKHKLPPPPVRQEPQEPLPKKPRTLLTERKPIKHLCKFCAQPFISKFVRDMHEKKHLKQGTVGPQNVSKPNLQKKALKQVKPSGRPMDIKVNKQLGRQTDIKVNPDKELKNNATAGSAKQSAKSSSLQIIPVKQQQEDKNTTNDSSKPSNLTPFVAKPYNEKDETFVDKKKQAMTKQAEAQKNLIAQKQNNNQGLGLALFPVKNNSSQENKSGLQRTPNPVLTQVKRRAGLASPNSVVKSFSSSNIPETVENHKQSACNKESFKESDSTFFDDEMKDMTKVTSKTISSLTGILEQQEERMMTNSLLSPHTGSSSYHDDSSGQTSLSNHFDELVSPRPQQMSSNYDEQKELENFLSETAKPSHEKSQSSFSARSDDLSSRKDSSERHFDDMLSPEPPGLSTSSAIHREIENLLSDKRDREIENLLSDKRDREIESLLSDKRDREIENLLSGNSAKISHDRFSNLRHDVQSPEMQKNIDSKPTNQLPRTAPGLDNINSPRSYPSKMGSEREMGEIDINSLKSYSTKMGSEREVGEIDINSLKSYSTKMGGAREVGEIDINSLKSYPTKMGNERLIGESLQKHQRIKTTDVKLSDLGIGSRAEINFPNPTTVGLFHTQTTITNGALNIDKKFPTQQTFTNSSLTMTPILKPELKSSPVSRASEMRLTSPAKYKTTESSHLKEAINSQSTAGKYGNNQPIRSIFEVRNEETSRFDNLPFTSIAQMSNNHENTSQSMSRMSAIQGITSQSVPRVSPIQGVPPQSMSRISNIQGNTTTQSRISNIQRTTTQSRMSNIQGITTTQSGMSNIQVELQGITTSQSRMSNIQGITTSQSRMSNIQGMPTTQSKMSNIQGITTTQSRMSNIQGILTTQSRMSNIQGITTTQSGMSNIQGITTTQARLSNIQGIITTQSRMSNIQGITTTQSRMSNNLGITTLSMSSVSPNQGNNPQSIPRITANHGIATNHGINTQPMPRMSAIQGNSTPSMPQISTNQSITTQSISRMSNHGITIQSMSRNPSQLGNANPVGRNNAQMLPTQPQMPSRIKGAVPSPKMTVTPVRQNSTSLGIGPVPTALDPRPPSHQINRRHEEALLSPRKEHHVFPELNFNSDIKSGKGDVLEQTLKLSEITPDLSDEFDRLQNQGKKMPPLSYTNDRGETRTAQPPRMPALLSSSPISKSSHAPPLIQQSHTQELKLEDLRHVACIKPHVDISSPESIPQKEDLLQLSLNQTLDLTVNNKQNSASAATIHSLTSHDDLMDFSNITYQDVRQLIGQSDTPSFTIYPEPTNIAYSEVISSGQQQPVFLSPSPSSPTAISQSIPTTSSYSLTLTPTTLSLASNYFPVQSAQSPTFSLAPSSNISLASLPFSTVSALPSFGSDLVYTYSDLPSVSLDPNTVYTVPLGLQQFIQGGEMFQPQQDENFQDARRTKDSSAGRTSSTLAKWWT